MCGNKEKKKLKKYVKVFVAYKVKQEKGYIRSIKINISVRSI